MKSKIHNLIILDKSGSMTSISNQAIAGVNETIGTIKADNRRDNDACEHLITLVAFCGCEMKYIMEDVPAEEAKTITNADYEPCCMTPLYDTLGKSLNKLHRSIKDNKLATASVTIITDGYENASREFSGHAITSLIDRLKGQGWLFAYIGADHDVEAVAKSLSIDHHMAFEKSEHGTSCMFARERSSRSRWSRKYANLSRTGLVDDIKKRVELNDNYFAENDEEDGNDN